MDGARQMTPWRCRGGHVLGRVFKNGSKGRRLLLYRQAVDERVEEMVDVDVIAVVVWAVDVRCSICGRCRTWVPDPGVEEGGRGG